MKIAIISDSHDNVANLEKLISYLHENKISILLHAGDVCAPSVLGKTIAPNFNGDIHLIFGNVGDPILLKTVADKFPKVKYYSERGEFELGGVKIALVHLPDEAEKMSASGKFDLVVFGHNHQSSTKTEGKTLLVNPGTVGGLFNQPTFAIFDTESKDIELKELDSIKD